MVPAQSRPTAHCWRQGMITPPGIYMLHGAAERGGDSAEDRQGVAVGEEFFNG